MHVVDTNVPIVANGKTSDGDKKVSPSCRLAAVVFLEGLLSKGKIALDAGGLIQAEYHSHLNPKGQPGVGDRFYLAVIHSAPERIHREELAQDDEGNFLDFPSAETLKSFDPSDRKFAALARKLGVPVANAVDSDWVECREALASNGVVVQFLCGDNCDGWYSAE